MKSTAPIWEELHHWLPIGLFCLWFASVVYCCRFQSSAFSWHSLLVLRVLREVLVGHIGSQLQQTGCASLQHNSRASLLGNIGRAIGYLSARVLMMAIAIITSIVIAIAIAYYDVLFVLDHF